MCFLQPDGQGHYDVGFLPLFFFFFRPKEHFSTVKNLLWNGTFPWMLQFPYGTINVNKEPLFLRV